MADQTKPNCSHCGKPLTPIPSCCEAATKDYQQKQINLTFDEPDMSGFEEQVDKLLEIDDDDDF